MIRCVILNGSGSTKPTTHGESRGTRARQEDRRFFPVRNIRGSPPRAKREATMAGSRPPGEKRRDEDTLNASRRSDVSKYDPFSEPPSNERQAAWNKIAEAVEAYSVSTDASTLASLLREEAIVHFYMAEGWNGLQTTLTRSPRLSGSSEARPHRSNPSRSARSFPRPTTNKSANWWKRVAGNRCGRRSIPTHRWPRT